MRHRRCWVGLALVTALACGGSEQRDLFGGSGGSSGSAAGGSSGSSSGTGGATSAGAGGSGGGATGGVGGSSGSTTGGAAGSEDDGGSPGGGGGTGGSAGMGGSTGGSGGTSGEAGTAGSGGTHTGGWCSGKCGSSSPIQPTGCFCDDACSGAGDCCPDYGPVCNPAAGAGKIKCGGGTCNVGTQFCCQQFVSGGGLNPKCQPVNTQCIGPDIECDGPEDCGAGQVCCSIPASGNNNVDFKCRQASNCTNPSYRIVCGNDWTVCVPGQPCIPHPWVPQYNYCTLP
jgi:hypothetical protein